MAHCESIYDAIIQNDLNCFYEWIDRGAINTKDRFYGTPLQYAINYDIPKFVKIILDLGGRSTLYKISLPMLAIRSVGDEVETLKLLYDYGYRTFNPDENPVYEATRNNYRNKLEFLLHHFQVDIDKKYSRTDGDTSLYHAINNNDIECILLLLRYGANPNIIGEYSKMDMGPIMRQTIKESLLNYTKREHPEMYNVIMDYLENPIKEPE